MNEETAVKTLHELKNAFDRYNVELTLTGGTLLGAVREKHFIPWDTEIDLCMWATDFEKAEKACKELHGFKIWINKRTQAPDINLIKEDCAIGINLNFLIDGTVTHRWAVPKNSIGELLDCLIWILQLYGAELKESKIPRPIIKIMYNMVGWLPRKTRENLLYLIEELFDSVGSYYIKQEIPAHFLTDLTTIKFYDMNFKAPAKTEKYLAYRYGKNWRTPQRRSPRDIGVWDEMLQYDRAIHICSKEEYKKAKLINK